MSSVQSKIKGTVIVKIVYLTALGCGYASTLLFPDLDLLWRAAIADVVATVVVFIASTVTRNASLYDPYWSVIPTALVIWWVLEIGHGGLMPSDWLILGMVMFWSARLTLNWWIGWTGMDHEDWRYVDLKAKYGKLYPLVNFGGIHLTPTLLVFLGCLPAYKIIESQGMHPGSRAWLMVAVLITFGAIMIEAIADYQRRRGSRTSRGLFRGGIWRWSRHPNYFGEIMFWVGLFMYASIAEPAWYWTGVGALCMILLFVFISIPMMEKRQLANKEGYAEYQQQASSLVPLPPKLK